MYKVVKTCSLGTVYNLLPVKRYVGRSIILFQQKHGGHVFQLAMY